MSEFLPRGFVEKERRRVCNPDASFPRRVVSRIAPVVRAPAAIWDFVPGMAGPIVAVLSLILLVILGMQIVYSELPDAGIVDAFLEAEKGPADQWLYDGAELPQGDDLLLEISLIGGIQ